MTVIVGCVGQKGGPGKSTLARLLAVGVIRAGMTAAIADLDHTQKTVLDWSAKREKYRANVLEKGRDAPPPSVPCRVYSDVNLALLDAERFDYFVLDAPGRTGPEILRIAQAADIVVLPCNPGGDDMTPTVRVFNALVGREIPRNRLIVVLNHIGGDPEARAARDFLTQCGAQVLDAGLREKVVYRSALTAGLSPAEIVGKSKAAAALRHEAETVVAKLLGKITEIYEAGNERSGSGQESGGSQAAAE